MDICVPQQFLWMGSTSFGRDDLDMNSQHDDWPVFDSSSEQTLSASPYHSTQNSVENNEWSTACEEFSSLEFLRDYTRDASVPVEQLKNEILWPEQRHDSFQDLQNESLLCQDNQQSFSKSLQASTQVQDTPVEATSGAPQPSSSVEPPKRKRGRPRLYSPRADEQGSDGLPAHVLSARKSHLEKNRLAANKSRLRKKELCADLIANASELTSKNTELKAEEKLLREEVLNLKNELLRHAGCGSWAIDRYIARSAGDLLGVSASAVRTAAPADLSNAPQPTVKPPRSTAATNMTETLTSDASQGAGNNPLDLGSDETFWLLHDDEIVGD